MVVYVRSNEKAAAQDSASSLGGESRQKNKNVNK